MYLKEGLKHVGGLWVTVQKSELVEDWLVMTQKNMGIRYK